MEAVAIQRTSLHGLLCPAPHRLDGRAGGFQVETAKDSNR